MSQEKAKIWSDTEPAYECLIDEVRTEAFKKAIFEVVKPGSRVLEIGSGSGILSLFAADAGASEVHAVEIDPVPISFFRSSIPLNHYENVIKVIEGDALDVDLPQNVDVVIAELIETGLMDEMQVEVINSLHQRGVIGPNTKLIPAAYSTYLELIDTDNKFYGHTILLPQHRWPHYNVAENGWHPINATPIGEKVLVNEVDFSTPNINPIVDKAMTFNTFDDDPVNAVRLSGLLKLTDNIMLNATNAINGDKILPLAGSVQPHGGKVNLHISYQMGGGLGSFKAEQV